jgi:hypothetical protein
MKALIMSDCEGYEKNLFTQDLVSTLARHDFLIEIHDCNDIEISSILQERFFKSHDITIVENTGDAQKIRKYVTKDFYQDIKSYDLPVRHVMLAEGRSGTMEWFYFRSKTR